MAEAQERLLGPDGALHPAEFEITELALVETTNEDPAKVHVVSGNPPTHVTCCFDWARDPAALLMGAVFLRACVLPRSWSV